MIWELMIIEGNKQKRQSHMLQADRLKCFPIDILLFFFIYLTQPDANPYRQSLSMGAVFGTASRVAVDIPIVRWRCFSHLPKKGCDHMERILSIAILCMLLVATAGTAVAVGREADDTYQAGKSPVYQFDVTFDGNLAGKLVINTAEHTFVFNGKGLEPGTYYLRYTASGTHTFASVVVNKAGNVHFEGTWEKPLNELPAVPAFTLIPICIEEIPLQAVLTWWDWPDSCIFDSYGNYCIYIFDAHESTGCIVSYKLDSTISRWGGTVTEYEGTDPQLGSKRYVIPIGPGYTAVFVLTVVDMIGNTNQAQVEFTYP